MADAITIQMQTTREDYDAERQASRSTGLKVGAAVAVARPAGGGLTEARFVEAIAAPVMGTIEALVGRIVDDWLVRRSRGLSMDLTVFPWAVSDLVNVPQGFLSIRGPDGKVSAYSVKKYNGKEMAALVEGVLRSAQAGRP